MARSASEHLQIQTDASEVRQSWFARWRPLLASSVLHAAVLLLLASWMVPTFTTLDRYELVLGTASPEADDELEFLESLQLSDPLVVSDSAADLQEVAVAPEMANLAAPEQIAPAPVLPPVTTAPSELAQEVASRTSNPFEESGRSLKSAMDGRTGAGKQRLLEEAGGTAGSEQAVSNGLRWLINHQHRDGGWTLMLPCGQCANFQDQPVNPAQRPPRVLRAMPETRIGATGLALLPLLGAGQTHLAGELRTNVWEGLHFLLEQIEVPKGRVDGLKVGRLVDLGGNYYSHAIATIAICEAISMTGDRSLMEPAQLLVNEIVIAQDPQGGGWRYGRRSPGDVSVTGWQLMALKSAYHAGLTFPARSVEGAAYFLNSIQQPVLIGTNQPRTFDLFEYRYRYQFEPDETFDLNHMSPNAARNAVGVLCRMYLGVPKEDPIVAEGVKWISEHGPSTGTEASPYFNYYAAQVMRHYGGPMWDKWNTEMRDFLVAAQAQEGHERGSWAFTGDHGQDAGRLYSTSLSTMVLEVYYRHLPLYQDAATKPLEGESAAGPSASTD